MTIKNTTASTIGEIILPNNSPNLIQTLLIGFKIFEFKMPKIKNKILIINDQILRSFSFNSGHNEIVKKTTKKRIPKLLLLFFFSLNFSFFYFVLSCLILDTNYLTVFYIYLYNMYRRFKDCINKLFFFFNYFNYILLTFIIKK